MRGRHHGRRRGSTRRIVGLVRTDDPRLELHSGSAPGRPSCGGPGAAPNKRHPPSSKPRGRGLDSALPGFNGPALTASPRSACCGECAMLSVKTVQEQWFSSICLDGVRQRPPRALLTTRFLTPSTACWPRRCLSTRRMLGLARTDDLRLELHSGSAPGRPSCEEPGATPNKRQSKGRAAGRAPDRL